MVSDRSVQEFDKNYHENKKKKCRSCSGVLNRLFLECKKNKGFCEFCSERGFHLHPYKWTRKKTNGDVV